MLRSISMFIAILFISFSVIAPSSFAYSGEVSLPRPQHGWGATTPGIRDWNVQLDEGTVVNWNWESDGLVNFKIVAPDEFIINELVEKDNASGSFECTLGGEYQFIWKNWVNDEEVIVSYEVTPEEKASDDDTDTTISPETYNVIIIILIVIVTGLVILLINMSSDRESAEEGSFCGNCGAQRKKGLKFCEQCGKSLE